MIHDQSWKWQSATSVNDRVIDKELMSCYLGRTLRRILNWAAAAWKKYPNKRILATKLVVKAALCQCHLNAITAMQTCTQLPDPTLYLALMMLSLSFGGKPCPSEWGTLLELICDLIIAILQHDDWDQLTLFAKTAQIHIPAKQTLPDDMPFGIGKDLIVNIPVNGRGTADIYIDDFIGLCIDLENTDNATRLEQAPLLGLTMVSCKVSPFEPLPCNNMDAQA